MKWRSTHRVSAQRNRRTTFERLQGQEVGFSLVEVLVAMVLMLVVLGGVYMIWFGLQDAYSFTNEDMTAQQQARTALGEIVEYVRTARVPDTAPSESLNAVIPFADANTLVLWTDTDRDPDHDLELVRFRLDTATRSLYRDVSETGDATFADGASVRLVSRYVSNSAARPLFGYATGGGSALSTPVSDPTQIREVHINLLIDIYTDRAPIHHELSSIVQPRNLRQY